MDSPQIDKFKTDYFVDSDSIISYITRTNFEKLIHGTLKHKIQENKTSHEVKLCYTFLNTFKEKIRNNKSYLLRKVTKIHTKP